MRISLPILFLVTSCAALAADLRAVRVWPGYRTDESFQRITEFLGNGEHQGDEKVLRTHPEKREGFYFFARVVNSGAAVTDAKIELSVLYPDNVKARVFSTFPALSLASGTHLLNIGLTGPDWVDAKISPVAWQLRLLAPDGSELLREQSFLWR